MTRTNLTGKTVVITGSTGGLGAALATQLNARGAKLALLDVNLATATAQAASFGDETVARGWQVDVRDLDSVQTAMDAAAEHFGRIDIVIANAGVGAMASIETMTPEVFDRVIDINLNGVWRTFRAAVPHVKKQQGYLLAISSMAAFVHSPLNGPYTASKAGVWALADSTRLELRHYGVAVGSAHPTFFNTPLMADMHADPAGLRLWNGNQKGLWKMITLQEVVDQIVSGIERRATLIVAPKSLSLTARIPGIVRPFVDRIGFPGKTIPEAMALADDGWVNGRLD